MGIVTIRVNGWLKIGAIIVFRAALFFANNHLEDVQAAQLTHVGQDYNFTDAKLSQAYRVN
jgi:hypothetical protein